MDSILVNTKTTLTLGKSEVFYKPLSLVFPIDTMHFELNQKNAVLNTLSIPLNEKGNSIQFTGNILNATSLVFDYKDVVITKVDLKSKELTWADFSHLFESIKQGKAEKEQKTEKEDEKVNSKKSKIVLNEALKGIYQKFNPSISIAINQFNYENFSINNFASRVSFSGESNLYLHKTSFLYHNGSVSMEAFFNISDEKNTFFDMNYNANKIDFGSFLKEFKYFGSKSLKDIEKLAGTISMDADIKGFANTRNWN